MKRMLPKTIACIFIAVWQLFLFAEADEVLAEQNECYSAPSTELSSIDAGYDEPQYAGASGYVVISASRAQEIEETERDERLWTAPAYGRSGDEWIQKGEITHKTPVTVLEQIPGHGDDGSFNGYLLVEESDNGEQYYINVENFLFKEQRFEAHDGTIVNYYIFFPDDEKPVNKLPILIYFHGTMDTMARHHGIGELLRTKQISSKGIVILPQAVNETSDADFHKKRYQDAVIELANVIAEEYNGDTNRLSVSGHSDGGIAAYQIVNGHPGIFAACAPISAIGNTGEGIKQTFLWVFQGAKDWWVKPSVGLRVVLKCELAGCNAMHYVYENEGHAIQTVVFQDTFIDETGSEVKLIDWLMSKELGTA